MRVLIALIAFFAALGETASAAIVTYKLSFFDDLGASFGSGVVRLDPDVKRTIVIDGNGEVCHPPLPIEIAKEVCGIELLWTPVDLTVDFPLFFGGGGGEFFFEGEISFEKPENVVARLDSWSSFDGQDGSGFRIFSLGDLFGAAGKATFEFVGFNERLDFFAFDGSVVAGLQEVPLPGAFGLFLAGIAGVAGLSRSGIRRDRQAAVR